MNTQIKYILKTLSISLGVGVVVAIIFMIFQAVFGRSFSWDVSLLWTFLYNMYFGVVLAFINALFFDYLNYKIQWGPTGEKFRILLGFIGSVPLTLFGAWFVRLTIEVGIEHQSFSFFIKNQRLSDYLPTLIITIIVSLIFHVVFLYKKLQENKIKEQKVIAGHASAQFETLKNQIDPHFLFNSLNVLSSLIEENPNNAQKFTSSLSKIYRYVLQQKDKELVPLREELDFAKTYMKLLQMRFEESLTYSLPDNLLDEEAKVVPLSLQLLLENTIKHNIVSDVQPLHISIYVEDGDLVVSNNLQKKQVLKSGESVGLSNIISRYAIITKRQVKVESDDAFFKVKIPILTKQINSIKQKKYNDMDAYFIAKKQVTSIRNFYGSALSFAIVIPLLILVNYYTYWGFKWFVFPMLGWGLGLAFQAFSTFGFGKSWEHKKINELVAKQQLINNKNWE